MAIDKKKVKEVIKEIKEHNPINNKAELPDGSKIKWKVKPNFGNLEKTQLNLEWDKNLTGCDVEVIVKINSQPVKLFSPEGDDKFKASLAFKKKF